MAKGELTILRCMRVAELLNNRGITAVADIEANEVIITLDKVTDIVVRPIRIKPVQP